MKLYLIRHGDPDYANDTLTARGHSEARELVAYLEPEGIARVVSSPMGRAMDTARYTSDALGLDMTVEQWMAELHLSADTEDRRAAWNIDGHVIRNRAYLDDPLAFEHVPGLPVDRTVQAMDMIRLKSDAFLSSLGYTRVDGSYRVDAANDERIAVFAHGGFGIAWLSILLEIPLPLMWSGFFLHTSSVTQILFDERGDGMATPRCIMLSALPHLFARSMHPGTSGIVANYT